MHLHDVFDSAKSVGLRTRSDEAMSGSAGEFSIGSAIELGLALNHVNRAMGLGDIYPFVVSPAARTKLEFAFTAISAGPALRLASN